MSWKGFGSLDLGDVAADSGGRATLRPGNHEVTVDAAEIKQTKDGSGRYIEVILKDATGAHVKDRINVHNRNATATKIGLERLKSLLVYGGHASPDKPGDIKSLVGLKVGVRVENGPDWRDNDGNVRPGGGQPLKNGAYFALDGKVELGAREPTTPTPAPAASSNELNDEIPF